VTIAVNVRMQRRLWEKNNLWSFHGIMIREVNLELIGFIGIHCARGSGKLNYPPLQIISGFVLETSRWVQLPFY
jgi:hypothetical protein